MIYSERTKEFIEEHISLIEDGKFENFVEAVDSSIYLPSEQIEVYKILRSCGIDVVKSLRHIPMYYFARDASLKIYKIPDQIQSIGDHAFNSCVNLKYIDLSNIIYIGVHSFKECKNLETIFLPATLKKIEKFAFNNCGATDFKYAGTVDEWNQRVRSHSSVLCSSGCKTNIVTCYDGVAHLAGTQV